jgi:hypothetical protein
MRPNKVRPPEGATLVVSILGVAILAILVGYSIGNWALGLLLSPRSELQTSSSLGNSTGSSYTYTPVGSTDSGDEDLTSPQDDQSGLTEVVVRGPYVTGEVELYKVRVGDFFTRQDAETVRDQLKAMGYTDSYVPPGEDAYAVQVGAFGAEANANSLAQALQAKGFDVYIVEQIKQ